MAAPRESDSPISRPRGDILYAVAFRSTPQGRVLMAVIRTVLGDIPPAEAGITLTHEHIRYAYQGCEFDHRNIWDLDQVADEIGRAARIMVTEYGIRTIVDLTPPDIGRHPELLTEVSRRSGAQVIAATGFYAEGMGIGFYWRRKSVEYIAELMIRDLTEGMVYDNRLTPYRAGIIKVATGGMGPEPTSLGPKGRRIGPYEDRVIRAAARAQRQTGCAIGTHTQPRDYKVTNPGIEMLDILEEEGANPGKVMMGHVFIFPEFAQLEALCARGAILQVDHIGIPWMHDSVEELDEQLADLICRLVDRGYLDNIVFSYDRFFSHGRGPITAEEPDQENTRVPLGWLFDSFVPRLAKKGFSKPELDHVLVDNPRRILAF
jgi:phosphotriesterase-related protein